MNSSQIKDLNLSDDILNLFCDIDSRLVKISKNKLDNMRYGIKGNCKNSTNQFFLLLRYKKILEKKLKDPYYITSYSLEDIMSKVQRHISIKK